MTSASKTLLLFDGVCNVCNAAVLFVIDHDPAEHFVFASLQSELGQRTLREHGLQTDLIDTVVVITGQGAHTYSDAALEVARRLAWPWRALVALRIVPRAVRDALYRAFARRRYALFGKSETCRVPTPELRRRFVG